MYATSTPCPAPEPGEYLTLQEFCDLSGHSYFTVRTQWEEMNLPFELRGGRRLISRSDAEQWIKARLQQDANKLTNFQADYLWHAMQARRLAK